MVLGATIVLFCSISYAMQPVSAAVDATLQPKANGVDVVRATIRKIQNSCIFPNDFGFLLRVAYVESKFGTDSNTFRTDAAEGGKGIWQMDRIGFDDTKLVSSTILNQVKQKFGIDWSSMTYESANMNVPLYNGLAARLLLYRKPEKIPTGIDAQAQYWKTHYNTAAGKGTVAGFISKVQSMQACSTVGADLLFILDGSGSIGSSNFGTMKQVLIEVANEFTIGPTATQIAVVTFASGIDERIDFGQYSTRSSLNSAIQSLRYSGGGTSTHLALNRVETMFQSARALNKGFPRVVIVLTDGASSSPSSTRIAAQNLNAFSWLERYAVGMGSGVNTAELEVIAPSCSHVYLISDVGAISGLTYDLYDLACQSSVSLPEGAFGHSKISGTLAPGTRRNVRDTAVSRVNGRTYALMLTSGRARLYVSLSMENPSSAVYDFLANATRDSHGVLFISPSDLAAWGNSSSRRKREVSSSSSSGADSRNALYMSIIPDADSETVNYELEAYDGDRRSLYNNSAIGHPLSFWSMVVVVVSVMTSRVVI